MTFNEYKIAAAKIAQYPNMGTNLIYPALGLVGEAGEVAEKIKKLWQNNLINLEIKPQARLKFTDVEAIALEMGDVLWYLAILSEELGIPFDYVAFLNLKKLKSRAERGVIKGEGDSR